MKSVCSAVAVKGLEFEVILDLGSVIFLLKKSQIIVFGLK